MGGLDSHFGENAGLDAALTAQLSAYLADNAAEKWDTWPANRLRAASEQIPCASPIPAAGNACTAAWPMTCSKSKAVGGKLNCSKCHRDAETGRFAPRAIAIPEEKASR